MKHIKSISDYIQEAVIRPLDIDPQIRQMREYSGIYTLEILNDIFEPVRIKFVELDEFVNTLRTDKEKELVPRGAMMMGGIKFALYNNYTKQMNVVVEKDMFLRFLNNKYGLSEFYSFIREVLRHETIHMQQVGRMNKPDLYNLEKSPKKPEEYFSFDKEIMAYAQSFIDQMTDRGFTKEQILNKIKDKNSVVPSWIYGRYKNMPDKVKKRFLKYVYQYLDE